MGCYVDQAREYFLMGYNCAQSVLLAFAEPVGLTKTQALRIASPFGAGMGRMREVCGALSGLFMMSGLLMGFDDPADIKGKTELYTRLQEMSGCFKGEMGSVLCRDLLGDLAVTTPRPDERNARYYASRPCVRAIECAARLGEELLAQKSSGKI